MSYAYSFLWSISLTLPSTLKPFCCCPLNKPLKTSSQHLLSTFQYLIKVRPCVAVSPRLAAAITARLSITMSRLSAAIIATLLIKVSDAAVVVRIWCWCCSSGKHLLLLMLQHWSVFAAALMSICCSSDEYLLQQWSISDAAAVVNICCRCCSSGQCLLLMLQQCSISLVCWCNNNHIFALALYGSMVVNINVHRM